MSWWNSPEWAAYEKAYGHAPGTRSRLLADATFNTQIVDLTQSEADLWRDLRKSYKSLIHKAEKTFTLEVDDTGEGVLVTDRQLHRIVAGVETRSLHTWALMQNWCAIGHGLSVRARRGEHQEAIAFAFFIIGDSDWSYYASAASLAPNVNHALIWHAMIALKAKGVSQLELGWQGQADTEKGKGIEHFRAGFGGVSIPVRDVARVAA